MFQFQYLISISDIVNSLLFLVAGCGIYLTIRQLRQGYDVQKATFFKELYTMMLSDPDMREAFYVIEYDKFIYDERFHGSSEERLIDRLLTFFDLVCDLYAQRILTTHEMRAFRYFLLRVYQNAQIKSYIEYLEVFYLTIGIRMLPYQSFFSYCEKEQKQLLHTMNKQTNNLYLSVDQAFFFYKEQKSKLDKLLTLAEQEISRSGDGESSFNSKIEALDMLKDRLVHPDNFVEDDPLCRAINESGVNDPERIIIGLEALRARLTKSENDRSAGVVYNVSDKISIKHLFRNWGT